MNYIEKDPRQRLKFIMERNRKYHKLSVEDLAKIAQVRTDVINWVEEGIGQKPNFDQVMKTLSVFPFRAEFLAELTDIVRAVLRPVKYTALPTGRERNRAFPPTAS